MDTATRKAGAKALEEIREAVLEILELLDSDPQDYQEQDDETSREQVVIEALRNLNNRMSGSYHYSGLDGWEAALSEPLAEPFNAKNW